MNLTALKVCALATAACLAAEKGAFAMENDGTTVFWQAHRGGGGHEMPDNTLASARYGWSLGGAPELDIRLSSDGEIVCLHDDTLERTTDAPPEIAKTPIRNLSFEEIRKYDAGKKFSPRFAGEKVPALREIFEALKEDPKRGIYADIKNYDAKSFDKLLGGIASLAAEYGVASQIIVCSCDYKLNCKMKDSIPGARAMQWIGYWGKGDPAAEKMRTFRTLSENGFAKLDEVQIHLNFKAKKDGSWPFDVAAADLKEALDATAAKGVMLQVFPWSFDESSIHLLLDLGIRSFATDEPAAFKKAVASWQGQGR